MVNLFRPAKVKMCLCAKVEAPMYAFEVYRQIELKVSNIKFHGNMSNGSWAAMW
jgi:hypothetical protein